MNPVDEQLNRLMKAASAAPAPAPGAAVFALEARVMGGWRAAVRGDSGEFLVAWFRRAAICGCLLALVSVAWDFHDPADRTSAEVAIAGSALGMGVEP